MKTRLILWGHDLLIWHTCSRNQTFSRAAPRTCKTRLIYIMTWLIHMKTRLIHWHKDMTHWYGIRVVAIRRFYVQPRGPVGHDSYTYDDVAQVRTWLLHTLEMTDMKLVFTYSPADLRDMTNIYYDMTHSYENTSHSMTTWLIHTWEMTDSHVGPATHCSTLQRTATHCNILQHTATHCNALQHTATHFNTLATHLQPM